MTFAAVISVEKNSCTSYTIQSWSSVQRADHEMNSWVDFKKEQPGVTTFFALFFSTLQPGTASPVFWLKESKSNHLSWNKKYSECSILHSRTNVFSRTKDACTGPWSLLSPSNICFSQTTSQHGQAISCNSYSLSKNERNEIVPLTMFIEWRLSQPTGCKFCVSATPSGCHRGKFRL